MSKRILIADDSTFWREQFRGILERDRDWDVYEAGNGSEALQKSQQFHPDLVILDYSMPVLDGLGAARELVRTMPQIPVLLCTVDKSQCLQDLARETGVSAVFSKIEWSEMLGYIERQLEPERRSTMPHQQHVA
jgi:CheY-like chemotaxis protein